MRNSRKAMEKAKILLDSFRYIKKFQGKIMVIKAGGETLEKNLPKIARDIVFLHDAGVKVVFVHGGGREISAELNKRRIKPAFSGGLRVTDDKTMEVVEQVLLRINRRIVSEFRRHRVKVIGLSGRDAGLMQCVQKKRSLGRVGSIVSVKTELVNALLQDGILPVICTVGSGRNGESMNVNADDAASSMACAMHAEKLTVITNVDGILSGRELVSSLTSSGAEKMIDGGAISGGMIPKVRSCISAVKGGVKKAHIINGLAPHALLLELYTRQGIGTEVLC
ncbi:MAG: acetylglutamate kinase [Candidatus Micrarchaeia archaeon]